MPKTDPKQIVGASLVAGGAGLAAVINIPGISWSSLNLIVVSVDFRVWNWSVAGVGFGYGDTWPLGCTSSCVEPAGPLVTVAPWLLIAATLALATGTLLGFLGQRKAAAVTAFGGVAIGVVMAILFTIGLNDYSSEIFAWGAAQSGSSDAIPPGFGAPALAFGFYLVCAGFAAAVAGAILLLVAKAPQPTPSDGYLLYVPPPGAYGNAYGNPYPGPSPPGYAAAPRGLPAPGRPASANVAAPNAAAPGVRRLRCPRCTTVFAVAAGARPVCTGCGYGA